MQKSAWSNKIDCILGSSDYEGGMHHRKLKKISPDQPKLFEDFLFTFLVDTKDIEKKAQRLKDYYCNESITQDPTDQLIYCLSDKQFQFGNRFTGCNRIGPGKTWLYRFAVEPKGENYDYFRKLLQVPHKNGSMHMEYLLYMFKLAQIPAPKSDSNEYRIIMNTV